MIQFVVGTRAQLLKVAPVMLECERRGLAWRWVYTAQHRDTMNELLETFGLPPAAYVTVRWQTEAMSMSTMALWFSRMLIELTHSRRVLGGFTGPRHLVVTHGDTFTTWMAALMGRLTRTKVLHVESGLRSGNLREPFPEEINRLLTFVLANYYACQDDEAVSNLSRHRGPKLNTHGNTQIDTLRFGLEHSSRIEFEVPAGEFVVATIHRYENIFNRDRFTRIVDLVGSIAQHFDVLFIRHPATDLQLRKLGLEQRLASHSRVHLLPRLEYLPFIKALRAAAFVVTDGGGNQAELSYLGKPTLIFRDEVEQREGIGENIVISRLDPAIVEDFIERYSSFNRELRLPENSPAATIVDFIEARGFGSV
jgi:UDP-N-acetylglucosamine 2-epimerase (non-hydrolysing)